MGTKTSRVSCVPTLMYYEFTIVENGTVGEALENMVSVRCRRYPHGPKNGYVQEMRTNDNICNAMDILKVIISTRIMDVTAPFRMVSTIKLKEELE
jgi:hypothetical protein